MTAADGDFLVEYVHGKHTFRDYFERFFDVDTFGDVCEGCPELAAALHKHLLTAFEILDALPRTDPFWAGSNFRTTVAKVETFFSTRPVATAQDAWPALAVGLLRPDLGMLSCAAEVLFPAGELGAADLVRTFYNAFVVPGGDVDEQFTELAIRLVAVDEFRLHLGQLATSAPAELAEWAANVSRRLAGA